MSSVIWPASAIHWCLTWCSLVSTKISNQCSVFYLRFLSWTATFITVIAIAVLVTVTVMYELGRTIKKEWTINWRKVLLLQFGELSRSHWQCTLYHGRWSVCCRPWMMSTLWPDFAGKKKKVVAKLPLHMRWCTVYRLVMTIGQYH